MGGDPRLNEKERSRDQNSYLIVNSTWPQGPAAIPLLPWWTQTLGQNKWPLLQIDSLRYRITVKRTVIQYGYLLYHRCQFLRDGLGDQAAFQSPCDWLRCRLCPSERMTIISHHSRASNFLPPNENKNMNFL